MSASVPESFVRVLDDLSRWLAAAGVPALFVGGVFGQVARSRNYDLAGARMKLPRERSMLL
jgi:hypothetical protein